MKIEYTHTFFYPNTLQRKRKKKKNLQRSRMLLLKDMYAHR